MLVAALWVAALVLAVIGLLLLVATILTYSTILAVIEVALGTVGLLLVAIACGLEGDLVNWRQDRVDVIKRKRVFKSQLFARGIECAYVVLSFLLPSTWIRWHFVLKRKDLPADKRTEKMSCCLELYLLAMTGLLVLFAWSQSYPSNWQFSGWRCLLIVAVAWVVLTRIGEILLQSLEVVSGRIRANAASGLATLAIYVFQTVAIFAIGSEYAAYALGHRGAFKSENCAFPADWLDYAYLAWNNLVTFGAAYPPQTMWAMTVVTCSSGTFILLFSVLLAYVVAKVR